MGSVVLYGEHLYLCGSVVKHMKVLFFPHYILDMYVKMDM